MKKCKIIYLVLAIIFGINFTFAQQLTGVKIMQNMKDKAAIVQDYTAEIEANINMENIRIPKIKLTMYHKYPDKFHYESKSFALLPKQGLSFDPFHYDEKDYNFNLLRSENLDNTQVYVVEIESKKTDPKKKDKIAPIKTDVWVDANNWVPKKIGSEPNESRKVEVIFEHQWIDGKYYLPSKIYLNYDIPDLPEVPDIPKDVNQKGQKMAHGGKGGKGSVTLTFISYKVNTGLSDDIFKEKDKKEKTK